jgi:hypothetical protein
VGREPLELPPELELELELELPLDPELVEPELEDDPEVPELLVDAELEPELEAELVDPELVPAPELPVVPDPPVDVELELELELELEFEPELADELTPDPEEAPVAPVPDELPVGDPPDVPELATPLLPVVARVEPLDPVVLHEDGIVEEQENWPGRQGFATQASPLKQAPAAGSQEIVPTVGSEHETAPKATAAARAFTM